MEIAPVRSAAALRQRCDHDRARLSVERKFIASLSMLRPSVSADRGRSVSMTGLRPRTHASMCRQCNCTSRARPAAQHLDFANIVLEA